MKHIPPEYLNKKVKLINRDGFVVYGYITKIDSTFICFETKKKMSLLGIRFIEDISLAKRRDISQSSPVENKPKETFRNDKEQEFLYSKWWKNEKIKEGSK